MATDVKNKKILIIVESPNKCSTITSILKKAGYEKATVTASLGHIMELGDGGKYHNSGIDPENDFELNLKISQDKHETVKKLKALARTSDYIYIMSDGDREGELIAWSLIKFLGVPKDKYFRAVTHEITPKAVIAAMILGCIGLNAAEKVYAWNFVQGNFYGIPVSGLNNMDTIFQTTMVEGKERMHGGAFGMEGGFAVTIVLLLGIVFFTFYRNDGSSSAIKEEREVKI